MHRTGREPPQAGGSWTLCALSSVPVLLGPGCSRGADSFGCLPQGCPQDPTLGEFQAMQSQEGRKWPAAAREIPEGADRASPSGPGW